MNPIIELFKQTSNIPDHWQRSALGMVDSFARGSNVAIEDAKYINGIPRNRDALAAAIIPHIEGLSKEESYAMRHEARDWLDAPYRNDPQLLKWRESRALRGGIREKSE